MDQIGLIAAPGFRSRAYAQWLVQNGLKPNVALLLPGKEPEWNGDEAVTFDLGEKRVVFRPNIPTSKTLAEADVEILPGPADLNSPEAEEIIQDLPPDILIYAGAGGALLAPRILATGKRFLHIHGGRIPRYRGSTAFYYSLLEENSISVSALWLDKGIDTGPLIARKTVPTSISVEIDRVFDPCLRADLLVELLQEYASDGTFPEMRLSKNEPENTYFVIHPVLKHVALQRCGLIRED